MRSWRGAAALAAGLGVLGGSGGVEAEPVPQGKASAPAQAAPEARGAVAGKVSIQKDDAPKANRAGVVVYLEGVPGGAPAPQKRREIRQKNLTFTPGLMVITVGTTVEFPNDDKVFHNVFSVSSAARFDLGLYKSGTKREVTFKRPGVVDVYCNIHPQMIAKIKVLDTRYYAVTAADGSFRIGSVPPGTYALVAWQAYGSELRGEATVEPGGTASVALSLVEGRPPKRHLRKDGTPYGRYK